jgi:hypothetical protein
MTVKQRNTFLYGFDTYVISAYITMFFDAIESAFRIFYSSIFEKDSPINFHEVYEGLLCALDLYKYKNLLKLFRLIRNCYHNNGIHTSKDDHVPWKNVTFNFNKGEKPKLGDVWSTLIMISTDLLEMAKALVESDTMVRIRVMRDTSYDDVV